MSVRIALLICGGLTGKALEKNGDYLDVYTRYLRGTVPTGVDFTLDPFFVAKEHVYPNEENYDCIMLTGSAASAYDDIEWINNLAAYIARVAANANARSKIIGICFGHQIIARALGGQCVPNNGIWEVGPTAVRLTAVGQKIFGDGSEDLTIQQMHRDHVPVLPPGFELLGATDISPVQGMVRFVPGGDRVHILTVQGHPEFTEPIVTAIIAQRSGSGAIGQETAADYEANRRYVPDDGPARVGRALWKVMTGEL